MQNDDGELHRQHLQSMADEEEIPEQDQDQARLRFDDQTRKDIARSYSKQAPKKLVRNDFDVELFIRILEGAALFYRRLQTIEVRTQKERLRSIDAAAAAFEKSVERIKEMDSGALGCCMYYVAKELSINGMLDESGFDKYNPETAKFFMGEEYEPLNPQSASEAAHAEREETVKFLGVVALGFRRARSALAIHDLKPKLKASLSVERLFSDHKIPFIASDSSFAADCLRSVFQLGQLEAGTEVQYPSNWIAKALDHPDSQNQYIKQLREGMK